MVKVDTSNILFICGGAFEGIDRLIATRMNQAKVGFKKGKEKENIDTENFYKYVSPLDLRSFGLIPELIGRTLTPNSRSLSTAITRACGNR